VVNLSSNDRAPILVTGSHRSGSTWVGKMLCLSAYAYYLGELFNPDNQMIGGRFFNLSFAYVPPNTSEPQLAGELNRILQFRFQWAERLGKRIWRPSPLHGYRMTRKLLGIPRPLVKDPIAVLSSAWLAQQFQMKVIVVIRHPAAFVASLQRAGWAAGFNQFLAQPQLMEDWLYPYADMFRHPSEDFIERAALLWTAIYYVVKGYLDQHDDWYWCRLEDVAREPLGQFNAIYSYARLPYRERIQRKILSYSSPANPVLSTPTDLHNIRRNSAASLDTWRDELSATDINNIRRIAEPIAHQFYHDHDW
jgi:hypothetical protein